MGINNIKKAIFKTWQSMKKSIPTLLGIILLISLVIEIIPNSFYKKIFTGTPILDPIIGAILGSISAGNPLNSYIIGGELLTEKISLVAIIAFILSWVTVGIIQLPAESLMLGRKFAILRNSFAFISAIIIAVLSVYTMTLF